MLFFPITIRIVWHLESVHLLSSIVVRRSLFIILSHSDWIHIWLSAKKLHSSIGFTSFDPLFPVRLLLILIALHVCFYKNSSPFHFKQSHAHAFYIQPSNTDVTHTLPAQRAVVDSRSLSFPSLFACPLWQPKFVLVFFRLKSSDNLQFSPFLKLMLFSAYFRV